MTAKELVNVREHVNNSIDTIRHLPSMDDSLPLAVGCHERWGRRAGSSP